MPGVFFRLLGLRSAALAAELQPPPPPPPPPPPLTRKMGAALTENTFNRSPTAYMRTQTHTFSLFSTRARTHTLTHTFTNAHPYIHTHAHTFYLSLSFKPYSNIPPEYAPSLSFYSDVFKVFLSLSHSHSHTPIHAHTHSHSHPLSPSRSPSKICPFSLARIATTRQVRIKDLLASK